MKNNHWKNRCDGRTMDLMNQDIATRPALPATDRCFPWHMENARRGRLATSTLFLVDGMTFGTWAALIPSFQHKFELSAGQLSWVLFGLIVGALVSMPITGRVVAAFGSRRVAFPAALAYPASLPLLALAPSFGGLVAAAVVFGALKGVLDVSVNSQGVTVENAIRKPIISSFQGFWSLGGLGAAFFLSLAMNHGFPAMGLMMVMSVVLFVMALATLGSLLPEEETAPSERSAGFSIPDRRLLALGALAFLALFSEGVLLDWSAVYARNVTGVSIAVAPVAFAVFALCMAGGRFLGDLLIAKFGPATVLRVSGFFMTLGIAIAAILQTWPAVLVGFATVGLGVANLVPVIFGAAGRVHESGAGPGLATVTTMGYLGFLSGPPVIGMLAAFASLPVAFGMVVVFGVVIATFGTGVLRSARPAKEAA
jgi:MFS family permease